MKRSYGWTLPGERETVRLMADHERMFSAISAYVSKHGHVELENDLQSGTMTVVFKSHVPSEGRLLALRIYGTRNVEITLHAVVEWRNFRRVAQAYADALAVLDCFHLIEVEPADSDESYGKGRGLRIAGTASRESK
jgi:hypothetical protein